MISEKLSIGRRAKVPQRRPRRKRPVPSPSRSVLRSLSKGGGIPSISARLRPSEANNRAHPPTTQRSATTMKTNAAVLWGLNQKWEVEEVDLDGPKEAEVLVKLTASGLCHSDHHLVTGDLQMPLPAV